MATTGGGGPAFPTVGDCDGYTPIRAMHPGMTLRDYFAGQALAGMLAADGNDPRWTGRDANPEYQRGGGKWLEPTGVATQSYEIADAMLAQRAAGGPAGEG